MSKTKAPWPCSKLSQTLPAIDYLGQCQHCRAEGANLWIECDQHDRGTAELVSMCDVCAEAVITPHPRLYVKVAVNKPMPGAMAHICGPCKFREVLKCTHPNLKANGGPGLGISVVEPLRGFVDGRDYRGPFESWRSPARSCSGLTPEA